MLPYIVKSDGEREPFAPNKLLHSLVKAGASPAVRAHVLDQVQRELVDGMTTEQIYKRAHVLLTQHENHPVAARYSLKRAVLELGPSGFPFEQFVAEILRAHGWKTRTDVNLTGRCAPHEVDVVATRGGTRAGIEVKFHNTAGPKTDVKDALYVHARFEDLKVSPFRDSRVDEGWLVTNTRFTRTALRFGQCSGLTMISWDYPRKRGLFDMIEEAGVHPLTCLTTLTQSEKKRFLDNKVVLCRSIRSGPRVLEEHGVAPSRIPTVMAEANQLCILPGEVLQPVDTKHSPVHHVAI